MSSEPVRNMSRFEAKLPPGMPFWKVGLLTLILIPIGFGLYFFMFDTKPTPTVKGKIIDDTTQQPVPDVIIVCRWSGRTLTKKLSGPILYGSTIVKSNQDGTYSIPGIIPGLNCRGIRWITYQMIEFFHPLYDAHQVTIDMTDIGDAPPYTVNLRLASETVKTETDLHKFFSRISYAFGTQYDSVLNQARRAGLTPAYPYDTILTVWENDIFSKFSKSRVYLFSWKGFKEGFRKAHASELPQ